MKPISPILTTFSSGCFVLLYSMPAQECHAQVVEPVVQLPPDRQRRADGGRKSRRVQQPGLVKALDWLIEPLSRGEPTSPLRWTCKGNRQQVRDPGHFKQTEIG